MSRSEQRQVHQLFVAGQIFENDSIIREAIGMVKNNDNTFAALISLGNMMKPIAGK